MRKIVGIFCYVCVVDGVVWWSMVVVICYGGELDVIVMIFVVEGILVLRLCDEYVLLDIYVVMYILNVLEMVVVLVLGV